LDDIITIDDNAGIAHIKQAQHSAYTIKDLGLARYFLGIEIARSKAGTFLNQRKYIPDILTDAGLTGAKPAKFPVPKGLKLSIEVRQCSTDHDPNRRLIGRLLYLTLTRPDVSYGVQHLSQFLQQPREPHFQAAMHIFRYLKGTADKGLFYPNNVNFHLTTYCDADGWTCKMFSRSLTGYCIFIGSSLVSWKTKKQKTVAKSSAEAEYRAMSYTTFGLEWLFVWIFTFLYLFLSLYIVTIRLQFILLRIWFSMRDRHLNIDRHYTRDKLLEGFLQPAHFGSKQQLALGRYYDQAFRGTTTSLLSFKVGFDGFSPNPP